MELEGHASVAYELAGLTMSRKSTVVHLTSNNGLDRPGSHRGAQSCEPAVVAGRSTGR